MHKYTLIIIFQCLIHTHVQLANVAFFNHDVIAAGRVGRGWDVNGNIVVVLRQAAFEFVGDMAGNKGYRPNARLRKGNQYGGFERAAAVGEQGFGNFF